MLMARYIAAIMLAVLLVPAASLSFAQSDHSSIEHSVTFFSSPDAQGTLDRERVLTCLRLLLRELNLSGKELPHIVVIHASRKSAHAAGVEQITVRRQNPPSGDGVFYEFWMIGEPSLAHCTAAMDKIVEDHFALKLTADERKQITARVLRHLQNTVAVHPNG